MIGHNDISVQFYFLLFDQIFQCIYYDLLPMIRKPQILPTVDGGGEEPGICVFDEHITKIVNHSIGGGGFGWWGHLPMGVR